MRYNRTLTLAQVVLMVNMSMIIISTVSHIFHSRMYYGNCGEPKNASATCMEKTLDHIREEVTDFVDIIAIGAQIHYV